MDTNTLRVTDAKEIAQWIRTDLKRAFPSVVFSVRKPHHGTVQISWTDGPTDAQVSRLVKKYEGKGFDGSTDSTIYYGPVTSPTGEQVKSYSWVFTQRHTTEAAQNKVRVWP